MVARITVSRTRRVEAKMDRMQKRIRSTTLPRVTKKAGNAIVEGMRMAIDEWADNPSGKLAKSFETEVTTGSRGTTVRVTSDSPYARIHDTGGVIKPKRAKNLAIPLTPKARRTGSPRKWSGSKLFRRGNALAVKAGRGARNQYALAKQARIRKKGYVRRGMMLARPRIQRILRDEVRRAAR